MKAIWKNTVLADSEDIVTVEGNAYFPVSSLTQKYFVSSDYHTTCPWKGEASYYDVVVGGDKNDHAAWFYPSPKEAAREIAGRVAFWRGIEVVNG